MTTDADRAARERLAQEARATATTLLDWVGTRVESTRADSTRTDGTRAEPGERPRQSPGPCTWCPVCALVAALRGEQPELTATLAEQASGLLVLLRLLVQAHATGSHDHHDHQGPSPTAPSPTAPSPTASSPAAPQDVPGTPVRPAEWGAPTWPADVPWDVAPHATFDPAPPARDAPPESPAEDARTAPDRPTGRRGPRPSPRRAPGAPATDVEEPVVTAAPPEPVVTGPVVRNPATGTRRGVQRIPVRRRPRPC
ncbi:hypothetical protein [Actinomycetospora sp. NBRC 106378]|uniref:hypothetical protein n=1 Tax=Actinomycetospora sp. NBRC 106378 TaxID=3032208 RepID=UPI0024A22154|nr:hypothetical protein [Actinomycetospora sp. NBRC 106378]GLZ53331.1 hypothetical protein Acsp07_29480 [Actinomycetospora sp. NBRC 106378]